MSDWLDKDSYECMTSVLEWQKMEMNSEFATPPTFYIPDHVLISGKMYEYVKSLRPYLKMFPGIKLVNKHLKSLSLEDFDLMIQTRVISKRFSGLQQTCISKLSEDISEDRTISLQEFVDQHPDSITGSVVDCLRRYGRRGCTFKQISESDPARVVDVRKTGLQWDLDKENGTGALTSGQMKSSLLFGSKYSMSPFCGEEGNLMSLNMHLYGNPKVWYLPVQSDIQRIENIMSLFPEAENCRVYHRHKYNFLNMSMFRSLDTPIPIFKVVQHPGEILLTNSFHQEIDMGFNATIKVNIYLDNSDLNKSELGGFCGTDCTFVEKSRILGEVDQDTGMKCHLCPIKNTFTSSLGYEKHMRKHKIFGKKGTCPFCKKEFGSVEKHVKSKHKENISMQVCGLCRGFFISNTDFRNHWTRDHKKGERNCKTCNTEVESMVNAKTHNCS